jgi:outer membrane protein assembly factor BamD
MRKITIILALAAMTLTGCTNEFNQIYKSTDYDFKYEAAKEKFAMGKYTQASTLLEELVTITKGSDHAQECLYMLSMCEYCLHDYETASEYFKKYCTSYPKGIYAEKARFYVGESLYNSTPEPRLDQSRTVLAINAFQDFIDLNPYSVLKPQAQKRMFELQDKLVEKELYSAQLYYNLGGYFGNCTSGGSNFRSCVITAQNALKDYPYTKYREQFALLVMKAKYGYAQQSVEDKAQERYRDAEDESYGFINEYPDSENKKLAEKIIAECKKYTHD